MIYLKIKRKQSFLILKVIYIRRQSKVDSIKALLTCIANQCLLSTQCLTIKSSGKMWGPDGKLKDTKPLYLTDVMPEFSEIINYCKKMELLM